MSEKLIAIKFQHTKKLSVNLTKDKRKAKLIDFEEDNTPADSTSKEAKPLNIKLVDMGGHQEQRWKNAADASELFFPWLC